MFVFTFEERELIDRTTRYTDRAGARTVKRHAVERRTLFGLLTRSRPIGRPNVNRFRRDIEHPTRGAQYRGRFAFEIILRQVAHSYGVQRQTVGHIQLTLWA